MPGHDPDAQLRLRRGDEVAALRLGGQQQAEFVRKAARKHAFGGRPQVEQRRQQDG